MLFFSREAAEPVAWANLSSVQSSFLLFVQEILSHNHLKSLLQDECKMLCLCVACVMLVRLTWRKCCSKNTHACWENAVPAARGAPSTH